MFISKRSKRDGQFLKGNYQGLQKSFKCQQSQFITIKIPIALPSSCKHKCNHQKEITSNLMDSNHKLHIRQFQNKNGEIIFNLQSKLTEQIKLERQRSCNLQNELKLFRQQNQKLIKEKQRLLKKQRNTIISQRQSEQRKIYDTNTPHSFFSSVMNSDCDETIEVIQAVENSQAVEISSAETMKVNDNSSNCIEENMNSKITSLFNSKYLQTLTMSASKLIQQFEIPEIQDKRKNKIMNLKIQIKDLETQVKQIKKSNINFYNSQTKF